MEPDYSKYTQAELMDVYVTIDRERYPERFDEISQYIELEQEIEQAPSKSSDHKGSWVGCLVLGTYFLVKGCYSIYTGEYNGFKDVELTLIDDPKWFKFSVGLHMIFGVGLLLKLYDLRYNKSLN